MSDRFQKLLDELGALVEQPLHPDKNQACTLNIDYHLNVQLKMDLLQERLLVATFVGEVPPGRFREEVFKAALKSNHHMPRTAILAYTAKNNQLLAFDYLPLASLNAESLAKYLEQLGPFLNEWRKGMETGQLPSISSLPISPLPTPFGLRP